MQTVDTQASHELKWMDILERVFAAIQAWMVGFLSGIFIILQEIAPEFRIFCIVTSIFCFGLSIFIFFIVTRLSRLDCLIAALSSVNSGIITCIVSRVLILLATT